MKKFFLIIIALSIISITSYSQNLTAIVYDEISKKPIPEVNVYLDGTSIFTTTGLNGEFNLPVEKQINTSLIISHIAYEMVTIAKPFEKMPAKIYLKEKTNVLSEAVVISKFTRKQKLNAFKEEFLGRHKAGKSCKILNEDDIELNYDYENNMLTASATSPVIIENDFLGYQVHFNLITFYAVYHKETLDKDWIKQTAYYGTSSFIDRKPDDNKINKRRLEVYNTSSSSFFKHLSNGTIKDSKWLLFNKGYQIEPNFYFMIKDTLSQKLMIIDPETNIDRFVPGFNVAGKISVLYNKKIQSEIIFLKNRYLIDEYGNISDIDQLFFSGYLGDSRLGYMLPLNFVPE